jgi:transcriptional regulator GlxA family with amidase domain
LITIGVLIFDDAEELDFVGPWEVFASAREAGKDLQVVTVAQSREAIRCAKGMRVLPDHSFEDAPPLDIVMVPGGQGTRQEIDNPVLIEWLRKVGESCTWVTSVCTGSLLLSGAGFTDGRRITTHWGFIDALREYAPKATVLTRVRYVRDGKLVTAAGVSAGIDMALWLIGEIYEPEFARSIQHYIEYDPAPPYAAEV